MKMNYNIQPLAVLFGYKAEDKSMIFLGRTGEIVISDYTTEILQILSHCNGYNTLEEIQSKVGLSDNVLFEALVETCMERGILRDSRELLYSFHEDSANPTFFSTDISPEEISNLVDRSEIHPKVATGQTERTDNRNLLGLTKLRSTVRNLSSNPIDKKIRLELLEAMYTINEHRSTPSAGKLYPLEIYLVFCDEEDCSANKSVYRYNAGDVSLIKTDKEITSEKLARALDMTHVPGSLVIFVAADLSVVATKYANRGYRYALLEAGHTAQNAYLYATEHNLGLVEFGGFDDKVVANLLDLDYPKHAVLITLIVGYPDSQAPGIDLEIGNVLWRLKKELVGKDKPVEWLVRSSFGRDEYTLDKVLAITRYREPRKHGAESNLHNECYGLSTDSRMACIKALAEAFERYSSGLIRHDLISPAEKLDKPWLDPRVFTPFHTQQYSLLSELAPFNPKEKYQWIMGRRYTSRENVLVPVEHVFYPVRPSDIGRVPCYSASSSGVAAHFDYNQALERALLELIERDAVAVTWYSQRTVTTLPDKILPSSVLYRKEKWQKLGWKVDLLNITTDSVPVVLALITSDELYPHAVSGASAAYDYGTASGRALEEAETMLISWRFSEPRKGLQPEQVVSTLDHGLIYFQSENLKRLDWLRNSQQAHPTESPKVDILNQFDPIIVDLHKANNSSELNVVRTISERLLPINFGYGCEHYGHHRLKMLGLTWNREFPSFPHLFA